MYNSIFKAHVEYIEHILYYIREILPKYELKPTLLADEIRSGDDYFSKLDELTDKSVLGIVILDGFRPNILFEFGYLKGKNKPVIILASRDACINVKNLYDNA